MAIHFYLSISWTLHYRNLRNNLSVEGEKQPLSPPNFLDNHSYSITYTLFDAMIHRDHKMFYDDIFDMY